MPPVELSLLRPQINALMSHYADEALFIRTLRLLLEKYSEKRSSVNVWLQSDPGMPAHNLPLIVINELQSGLEQLAASQPQAAIHLAERMWELEEYEPKRLSVFTLARLPETYQGEFIRHAGEWMQGQLGESLISEIILESSRVLAILRSREWLDLLRGWIESPEKSVQRVGVRAVLRLLENREFENLPLVFELVKPLYRQPRIALQRATNELTRKLIERSQAETAAFLISISQGEASPAAQALVRKSLGMFDAFYQEEMRQALASG